MDLLLQLDRTSGLPLHVQLFEQIRGAILTGRLAPRDALPSTRDLAAQLAISRNTVRLAYDRLLAEGYLISRAGAGTFVAIDVPDAAMRAFSRPRTLAAACTAAARRAEDIAPLHDVFFDSGLQFDFALGRPDPAAFPIRAWRRAVAARLTPATAAALARYEDPQGYLPLRRAIARRLAATRGLVADPEQVVIVAGSQAGLALICRLCCRAGRSVGMEDPGYQGAALLMQALERPSVPLPVDRQGIVVDALPPQGLEMLYVTPSHQYPTGVTMSLERRLALLEWAERTDSLIVEDDYDSDFRYVGPPLTSLMGLDPYQRVIYVGTFSKCLGPGLRIGYLVVPPWMTQRARSVKALTDNGHALIDQMALTDLLESGAFDAHLRRLRRIYDERRRKVLMLLRQAFGFDVEILGTDAGLHLAMVAAPPLPPAEQARARAREAGVAIYTARCGGAVDRGTSPLSDRILTLGYASVGPRAIAEGVARLTEALGFPRRSHTAPRPAHALRTPT